MQHPYSHHPVRTRGDILIITLVAIAVFMGLFASLLGYLMTQYRYVDNATEGERALQIAEAGIEYYRWHLSHWPEDLQDGTGTPGPYEHIYEDPEVGPIGAFSLEIGGEVLCDQVQVVEATSTGWTFDDPDNTRTIVARIARPTVADYSYIVDAHVWAGASRIIVGPYHSNGVVRMDGDNRSAVTSKVDTANCGTVGLGGCTGTITGVYGAGSNPQWWRWAQPDIPFSNFDYDFAAMESVAQSDGIYLPKISNDTSVYGYYLTLKDDRTVDIYEVTSIWDWVEHYTPANQYIDMPELAGTISDHLTLIDNEPIPQDCPLIYVSDRTWLEGTVSGKVTVVANATSSAAPDLFLQNDITYSTTTGDDGLTVLAERNLLIPLYVPDDMTIQGVFFAQKGAYGRSHYGWLSDYNSYRDRNSLTTIGTVVSKLRTGTRWNDGQAFDTRNDLYDRTIADSPPPLTPFTSPDFRFIDWREVDKAALAQGGGGGGGSGGATPITFVDYSAADDNGDTSVTVTIPAGSVADDLLIATVTRDARNNNSGTWSTPPGWSQLHEGVDTSGRDRRTALYYKIHSGSETDPTFITNAGQNEHLSGMIHAYRDVDTSNPFDVAFVAGSHKDDGANDATPTNPQVTTNTDDAVVVIVHLATHDDITTATPPTNYTLRGTIIGSAKDHRQQVVADTAVSTAGTEVPGEWQHTTSDPNDQEYTVYTLVLRPMS